MKYRGSFTFFRGVKLCLKSRWLTAFTIALILLPGFVTPTLPGQTSRAASPGLQPAATSKKARVELETHPSPLLSQHRDFNVTLTAVEPEAEGFVLYDDNGRIGCRGATPIEALEMLERDPHVQLNVISQLELHQEEQQQTGLKIILRGTPQLEANPDAKAAFQRAAATWEGLIQSPITIVLDVDFGPTRFGVPWGAGVLGSTRTQGVIGTSLYSTVRSALISGAANAQERSLYNLLPTAAVPTDSGNTSNIAAPTAVLRALGELNPVADPDGERSRLGDPPSIGFNSNRAYDFDPRDGISPGRFDFDAVAVHEIGHALGFISQVGERELRPSSTLAVSVWDLYRFRPGTTLDTFTTAQRVLQSGGEQMFFAGAGDVPLSTGRNDGTGGDSNQPSHWKDDDLIGRYIGIMDPTFGPGQRLTITDNDLKAIDSMGYKLKSGGLQPGGADIVDLMSGMAHSGSLSAQPNTCVLSNTQYRIQVPAGASQLNVELSGNQDVDLYARFNQQVTLFKGVVGADAISDSTNNTETITITLTSRPALQTGPYFIAVTNCGPGAASFTLTATISTPPATVDLTSGTPRMDSMLGSPQANTCVLGPTQYRIQVSSEATQLKIELSGNQNVNLYARFNQRVEVQSEMTVADFKSESTAGTESITVTPSSSPALQQGTYFIAVANCSQSVATFTVKATIGIERETIDLTSGMAQMGSVPGTATAGRCDLGFTQYRIQVPSGATQLRVNLSGNQDVDLFVRFNQRVAMQGTQVLADFRSETLTGTESVTITPSSRPALQTGPYFIAVGNCSTSTATITVTATVTGGSGGLSQTRGDFKRGYSK